MSKKDTLSVKEVARLLEISEMTVHRMVADGRLKPSNSVKPLVKSQRWEFDRAYIMSFVTQQAQPPNEQSAA